MNDITWQGVAELINELITFYDEKIVEGPVDHQEFWKSAKEQILEKRKAVLAKAKKEQPNV